MVEIQVALPHSRHLGRQRQLLGASGRKQAHPLAGRHARGAVHLWAAGQSGGVASGPVMCMCSSTLGRWGAAQRLPLLPHREARGAALRRSGDARQPRVGTGARLLSAGKLNEAALGCPLGLHGT